jgi:DNA primase
VAGEADPRRLLAAHAAATVYYAQWLPGHLPALAYLHSRGVLGAVANRPPWTVGYAPAGWSGLRDALHGAGYTDGELLAAGLATTSRTGGVVDAFRDRVVFPVRSRAGHVVGFTARDLSGRPGVPKYRNTVTTRIYRKKRLLYGLAEQLLQDAATPAAVLIVEGPTDVLAVAGLRRWLPAPAPYVALSPCGTALTADQVALVRATVAPGTPLVLAFDADPAGDVAADRAHRLLRDWPGPVDVLCLPAGTDPAGVVARHGHGAVAVLQRARRPLVEVVADHRLARFRLDEAEGRIGALRSAAPLVAEVAARDARRAAALSVHLSVRLRLDPLTVFEAAYPPVVPDPPPPDA